MCGWDLDGHTEYQIRDHLGSTRLTIRATIVSTVTKNQTNKTLTTATNVLPAYSSVDYNPYGEKLGSNSTDKRVDGYGGNIYDGETDYVPMGARWRLPEIGRFLNADPMWAPFPALSPYIYANDEPISFSSLQVFRLGTYRERFFP